MKKGEHGVLMAAGSDVFSLPAYPLEVVRDPTGAGDSFAGGFVGSLACASRVDGSACRRSLLYGTVIASYAVEGFGVDRIKDLSGKGIERRYKGLVEHARIPDRPPDGGEFSLRRARGA